MAVSLCVGVGWLRIVLLEQQLVLLVSVGIGVAGGPGGAGGGGRGRVRLRLQRRCQRCRCCRRLLKQQELERRARARALHHRAQWCASWDAACRVQSSIQRVQRVQRVLRVQRGGACSRVRACAERIESTEVQRSHGVSARGRKVYGGWSTHQQACTPRAILLERCVSHGGVDERARCAVRRAVEGGTAAVKRSQLPRQTRSRVRVMARGPQRAYRPARGGVAYRAPVAEREDVLQQGARQREQATARFGVVILADQMTRAGGVNLLGVAAQPWLARECDDAASGRGGRAEAPPSHLELAPSRVGAYRHGWQRSLHTISDVRDLRVSTEGAVINPTPHKFGERRADKNGIASPHLLASFLPQRVPSLVWCPAERITSPHPLASFAACGQSILPYRVPAD